MTAAMAEIQQRIDIEADNADLGRANFEVQWLPFLEATQHT